VKNGARRLTQPAAEVAYSRWRCSDPARRLFVRTIQAAAASSLGAVCLGDSGGPIVLQDNGRDRIITAMMSAFEDLFAFPCTDNVGALNYRVDTETHLDFIKEVILLSLHGGPN
jgi:hypothetical protein